MEINSRSGAGNASSKWKPFELPIPVNLNKTAHTPPRSRSSKGEGIMRHVPSVARVDIFLLGGAPRSAGGDVRTREADCICHGLGKVVSAVSQSEESCWPQNRRAHFEPWPAKRALRRSSAAQQRLERRLSLDKSNFKVARGISFRKIWAMAGCRSLPPSDLPRTSPADR